MHVSVCACIFVLVCVQGCLFVCMLYSLYLAHNTLAQAVW